MKILLVTSSITYCPGNYDPVLEKILSRTGENIAGVMVISINPISVAVQVPYLYFAGCRAIARNLTLNMAGGVLGHKSRLVKKFGIPLFCGKDINSEESIRIIENLRVDLIMNLRTRNIFGKTVLGLPRLGCVNVHHGILPEQRGLFCDLHALAGNRETGFTIHEMTEGIDQGRIFFCQKVRSDNDYARYLERVAQIEGEAVADFVGQVAREGGLPNGLANVCEKPNFTTTPTREQIKQMIRKGLIL